MSLSRDVISSDNGDVGEREREGHCGWTCQREQKADKVKEVPVWREQRLQQAKWVSGKVENSIVEGLFIFLSRCY